jgi:hypothetical protein
MLIYSMAMTFLDLTGKINHLECIEICLKVAQLSELIR